MERTWGQRDSSEENCYLKVETETWAQGVKGESTPVSSQQGWGW